MATFLVGWLAALFVFAAAAGLTGSVVISACAAALGAGAAGLAWSRVVSDLDWSTTSRPLRVASAVIAILGLVALSRMTVFIIDSSRTSCSIMPTSEWETRHSCLTAYFVAADIVTRVPNVYDLSLYERPGDNPALPRKPRLMGLFRVDQFEYPPPFLLLPRALAHVAPGFLRLRMLWFGLNGALVFLGLVVVARTLTREAATRALVLVPFVLGTYVTLNTMQKGNVQLTVIAASMLAMVLLERKRWAAGGALLAFVTVAKLYPGLLVIYLLVRREWRALIWTGAFAVLFVALAIADVGWQPFVVFREHFSGLLSGEAFPAFRNPAAVAINHSIPGLVFKLKLFGLSGMDFGVARIVGTIYMLVAVAGTVVLARRGSGQDERPLVWMAILVLATLRSPFLPQSYAPFPALWLLTLMAATGVPRPWGFGAFVLTWLTLNIFVPIDAGMDPRLTAIITTIPQALMVLLAGVVVFSTSPRAASVVPTTRGAAVA
jgi:hypothetical protein